MTLLLPAYTQHLPLVDTLHCVNAMVLLRALPSDCINCVVTSPAYFGLRSYLPDNDLSKHQELGRERTPQEYVDNLVKLFREVRRVLRTEGSLFINLGDSFAGSWGNYAPKGIKGRQRMKTQEGKRWERNGYADTKMLPPNSRVEGLRDKNLIGIPWRVAFALQADGWVLRSASPWVKGSALPESVKDRFTTAHEYVFHFVKSDRYWFDRDAICLPAKSDYSKKGGSIMNDTGWVKGANRNDHKGNTRNIPADPLNRNRRTSDTFLDGLNFQIAQLESYLDHLRDVRENGGVILSSDMDSFDAFLVNPEPSKWEHFAAFPQALVSPCILATCPDKVCCQCGAPWVREIEVLDEQVRSGGMGGNTTAHADGPMDRGGKGQHDKGAMPVSRVRRMVGWKPSCQCNAPTRPGIVLDPFIGSGTTALVARANGRNYIGADLNPQYIAIAKERLRKPFEQHYASKPTKSLEDLPLFKEG